MSAADGCSRGGAAARFQWLRQIEANARATIATLLRAAARAVPVAWLSPRAAVDRHGSRDRRVDRDAWSCSMPGR